MVELNVAQKRAIAKAKALAASQGAVQPQQAASTEIDGFDPMRDLPIPGTSHPTAERAPSQFNANNAFQSGAMQGMTFGFGDEISAGLMTPIEMGIDAAQGKPFDPGRSFNQALEGNRALDAQMQEASPIAATAGNLAGAVGTGVGAQRAGLTLMNGAKPTVASMAGRGAVEGAAYGGLHGLGTGTDDKIGDALKGAAAGGAMGGVLGGVGGAVAGNSARKAAGTVDGLKSEATALYETARKSGAVLPQQQSAQMSTSMRDIAAAEGIITPTGRINESYTKLAALVRSFDDYGTGPLSVDQMQSVRKLIGNALKSPDGDERRIAMAMMEKFHSFLDPISPQIAQANQIYHRAMNAETLETLVDVARQKSGQYGRSFDATLREQFGALERQIIKGEARGFSEAEKAAISKVAQGGKVEDFLTFIGKAAPSGIVSAAGGAGVPFMIGNAMAGPVVGAGAAAGTMGAGLAARAGASAMTQGNANNAIMQALAGAGVKPMGNQAISPVVQALIAAGGNQVPQMNSGIARALALN